MTDTTASSTTVPQLPLFSRIVGVLFSPRETFAAIVARPRWFGAIAVSVVLLGICQFGMLSTDVGKEVTLDQQVAFAEGFGATITDEMYAQLERRMETARYTSPIGSMVGVPLVMAVAAGI